MNKDRKSCEKDIVLDLERPASESAIAGAVQTLLANKHDGNMNRLREIMGPESSPERVRTIVKNILKAPKKDAASLLYLIWVRTRRPEITSAITEHDLKPRFNWRLKVFGALDSGTPINIDHLGPRAVGPLVEAVLFSDDDRIRSLALRALGSMKDQECIDSLCGLWAHFRDRNLEEIIIRKGYIAANDPGARCLSALSANKTPIITQGSADLAEGLIRACSDEDPILASRAKERLFQLESAPLINRICHIWLRTREPLLSQAIEAAQYSATQPDKLRIFTTLKAGLGHNLLDDLDSALPMLVEALEDPDGTVSAQARRLLETHMDYPGVAEALCAAAIERGSKAASSLASNAGYAPKAPRDRALFLFLSEQWKEYEEFDFDMGLLKEAYEMAGDDLRRRIAAVATAAGRLELVELVSGSRRKRSMDEMTDGEWEKAISILRRRREWEKMWKIAKKAPGVWAVKALQALSQTDWQPKEPTDLRDFNELTFLAKEIRSDAPALLMADTPLLRFRAHGRRITAMIINSFFKRTIGASSWDGKVSLWGMKTGERTRDLPPLQDPITSLAASPDGGLLYTACAADRNVLIWDPDKDAPLFSLPGHVKGVGSLAVSKDGKILAAGGHDQVCRLWRLSDPTLIATLNGRGGSVRSVTFSPDHRRLATGSEDGYIRLWNLDNFILESIWKAHERTVKDLVFTHNSKSLISAGLDGSIALWNTDTGDLLHRIPENGGVVFALCLSNDGRVLAAACHDGGIRLYETVEYNLLASAHEHHGPVTCLATDPESRILVSGGNDCTLAVWNFQSGIFRRPTNRRDMERLESISAESSAGARKAWIDFLMAQMRMRWRYDIEISSAADEMNIGEFDIEIIQ
jgi:WD40 repeat protein